MKATAKRRIKKSLLVVPVLVMLIVLCFFINLFHRYDEEEFRAVSQDAKYTVDMIAETVENFREQGYKYDLDSGIYKTLVYENIVFLNQKPGVNARILDLNLNTIYEDKKIQQEYSKSLFSQDSIHYDEVSKALTSEATGEIRVENDDGNEAILYWRQIPAPPDSEHYLVLTIDKAKVLNNNIQGDFIVGIFIVSIIIMISLWDSLYLRLRK